MRELTATQESHGHRESQPLPAAKTSRLRGRLLVAAADSGGISGDLLTRQLVAAEHRATLTRSGQTALDWLQAEPFDLVFLGLQCEDMGAERFLARWQATGMADSAPVILLAAPADRKAILRCLEAGARDFLNGQEEFSLIQARVTAWLRQRREEVRLRVKLADQAAFEQMDRDLYGAQSSERVLQVALNWALRQTRDRFGLAGTVDVQGLRVATAYGYTADLRSYPDLTLPLDLPGIARVIESQKSHAFPYLPAGAGILQRSQSQLIVPLPYEDNVLGLIVLENREPRRWSARIVASLSRLGEHAGLALAMALRLESLEQASKSKSEFVSFVSHELKTPMTTIGGYADLLLAERAGSLSERQRHFLQTMRANVNRMIRLVSELTDIGRIEAGKLKLSFDAVAISQVIDEVVQSLVGEIDAKQQSLGLSVAPDMPMIWGDRLRLFQIMANLLSNAIKYTPEGGSIIISAHQQAANSIPDHPEPFLQVSIQDTGIGIAEREQVHIFERFFRAEDPLARERSGTGLGLHITRRLVEMHQGKIWFESVYGQGTTFSFSLPVPRLGQ